MYGWVGVYVSVGNRAVRLYKLPYNKLEKKKRGKKEEKVM